MQHGLFSVTVVADSGADLKLDWLNLLLDKSFPLTVDLSGAARQKDAILFPVRHLS